MTDFRVLVVSRQDWKVLKYSLSSYSMSERLYLRRQILNMGQTAWKYWNFSKSETRLRHVSFCEYWRLELLSCEKSEIQSSNFFNLDFYERERCFTAFFLVFKIKNWQRHNRPRVLTTSLEWSFFKQVRLKLISIRKNYSSCRLNTLDPLWQCLNVQQPTLFQRSCQVATLALVPILTTRWRYLNWLTMWPPDGTSCISCRFGQKLALLE